MKTTHLWLGAAAIALLGAGCGSSSTPTETPAKTTTAPPSRGVTLQEVALPSDFPTDVPRYAGSKIINAMTDIGQGISLLSLTSTDDSARILSWYDSELVRAGFSRTQDVKQGTVTSREYTMNGLKMVLTVDDQSGVKNSPASLFSIRRTPSSSN